MLKRIFPRSLFLFVISVCLLIGCGSDEVVDPKEDREYQRKLAEAQELAQKIREGDLFNEAQIMQKRVRNPENVCSFTTHFLAVDFGASPDFRGDGLAAIYNDKNGLVYYYELGERQRYKMWQYGQHPSFGIFLPDGNQKYLFQEYEPVKTDEGLEKKITGLLMNTDRDWLKPPKRIYSGPASHPFLVNEDKNVIFIENDEYCMLDENLQKQIITKETYENLRESRFVFDNKWKIKTEYKGIEGLWVTDLTELNWVQLRSISNLQTIKLLPVFYSIYCWGDEFAGILEIVPTDLPNYSIQISEGQTASVGDLFDVYEKKLSPISQEIIGYKKDRYKGSVRVIKIIENNLVCEFQTKLYQSGIFQGDAAVSQKNPDIVGSVL